MTTKRLAILFLVVLVGMSATFLLPKSAAQPFGVKLDLPATIGDWWGTDAEILEKEKSTLGAKTGTEFARKRYTNYQLPKLNNYGVLVSMVLSGRDINNSIHRPERCMDAQGYTILESEYINITLPGRGTFAVKRLHNRRTLRDASGREILNENKEPISSEAYTYYWFVGEKAITASHFGRMFEDNWERILRGVSQRWAFITITGPIPMQRNPELQAQARKAADDVLQGFIKELAPLIHKDGLKYD
jgi:hypothetical protein